MSTVDRYVVLELGSNSLKCYRVESGGEPVVATTKIPWRVAYDFFGRSASCGSSTALVLDALGRLREAAGGVDLEGALNVVTGVFRELPWISELGARVRDATGLRLRLITGVEEAKLMARAFSAPREGGALLCDLGGATTECAWFLDGRPRVCASLRLGAIRNHCALPPRPADPLGYVASHDELVARVLERSALPLMPPSRFMAIGGTARALFSVVGSSRVERSRVRGLIGDLAAGRVPSSVSGERAEVLAPGLVVLDQLASRCSADVIEHGVSSVREGLVSRLIDIARRDDVRTVHETLLLRTRLV